MIGIYKIESKINGNLYVGSAVKIKNRWRLHIRSLNKNKHHSIILQRHYNKYGLEDLEFSIIELCEKENLIKKEQYYIDILQPVFNIAKIANSSLGIKRSAETIEKVRQANLGLKHPEWRNKIKSISQGGENHWTKKRKIPFNEESRSKMSNSQKNLYKNGYKHHNRIAILQYTIHDEFIQEWDSIADAIRAYGKGISNNLTNKSKTAYGYKWKYK